jgi:predicted phage tail protein
MLDHIAVPMMGLASKPASAGTGSRGIVSFFVDLGFGMMLAGMCQLSSRKPVGMCKDETGEEYGQDRRNKQIACFHERLPCPRFYRHVM